MYIVYYSRFTYYNYSIRFLFINNIDSTHNLLYVETKELLQILNQNETLTTKSFNTRYILY